MRPSQKKALSRCRRSLKRRGVARLEVRLRKDDVSLVRGVLEALADPVRADEIRTLLRERFGRSASPGLKALLAAMPLGGVDLDRERDLGRDVDL